MTMIYVTDIDRLGFAVMRLPVGAVGLDIDAPGAFFEKGVGRMMMIVQVRKLATKLSRTYGLGLYWLYHTASGLHVIFQCRLSCWSAVKVVLMEAFKQEGWHECGGHAQCCYDAGHVQLRVGHKPRRRYWDINPVLGNPPVDAAPDHVREHARLLGLRLQVRGE